MLRPVSSCSSHATISSRACKPARATQALSRFNLDFGGERVGAVSVDGVPARWRRAGEELIITPRQWLRDGKIRDAQVLVIEWTHGNNDLVRGVDIPILLNSTPEETLAHRRARARDGALDSPFTTMVLGLEQAKLQAQAPRAQIIVSRAGELIDYDSYLASMGADLPEAGPMLNLYPDSLGGAMAEVVDFLTDPAVEGAFSSAYVLPSLFNTDLDRGFSVIDYGLNHRYATPDDLAALADAGICLKLDFILNHASVLSPQFQDLLAKGERSAYARFFVDWNEFWAGHGEMTEAMLLAAMTEVADHYITSATGEYAAWCTSLRMFGETCYTLARFRRDRANRR